MKSALQAAVRYLAFPLLMATGLATTFGLGALGYRPLTVAYWVNVVLFAILFLLERLIPFRDDWSRPDGQGLHDLGHAFVGSVGGSMLGAAFVNLTCPGLALWSSQHLGGHLWPASLPAPVQVLLIVLLADLGRYIQHRLHHTVPFLWRYHALHHDPGHLTALKSARSHIGERFLQQVAVFGPLVVLGAPPALVLWYQIPYGLIGFLAHANIDMRLGPFEYIVVGPASHRLHHSLDLHEGNSNFGGAILLWDMVFGTYVSPHRRPSPAGVGIPGDPQPRGFVAQLVAPFYRRKSQPSA